MISEEHGMAMIEIGADLGTFTIVSLLLDGVKIPRETLQELSDMCSLHVQEATGIPAEDFALMMQPAIQKIIDNVKG